MEDDNYFNEDLGGVADVGVSEQEGRALCEEARDLARDIWIAQMEFDVCSNELCGLEIDSDEWAECVEKMKYYNRQIFIYRDLADANVDYLKSLRTRGVGDGR